MKFLKNLFGNLNLDVNKLVDNIVTDFNVKENWIDLLQLVLITVIGAYFGGRSFEKVKKQ